MTGHWMALGSLTKVLKMCSQFGAYLSNFDFCPVRFVSVTVTGPWPTKDMVSDEVAAAKAAGLFLWWPVWLMAVGCCFMASLVVQAYLRRFVRPSHAHRILFIHMHTYHTYRPYYMFFHRSFVFFCRWETSRVPHSSRVCGWTTNKYKRKKIEQKKKIETKKNQTV